MPELPEVETIKNDLKKLVVGKKILGIKSEYPDIVKEIDFHKFKNEVIGSKITDTERRAKSLYIRLASSSVAGSTGDKYLLVHLKMTGHLVVTSAEREVKKGIWIDKEGVMKDPLNQSIRIQFILDDGNQIAFSDIRRFAYIKLVTKERLDEFLSLYGPEPFNNGFNTKYLSELFGKKRTSIKKVIMDQKNIAGIGNIYADEILFDSSIHPLRPANELSKKEIESFRDSTRRILKKALDLRGTSTSDYRDAKGEKGGYGDVRLVYKKTGELCPKKCGGKIERIVVGGRGTHFCKSCQKQWHGNK